METYSVRISEGEHTFDYTSDTSYAVKDNIIEFAKNTDVNKLIITLFWSEKNSQQFVDEAIEVFEKTFVAKEGDIYNF